MAEDTARDGENLAGANRSERERPRHRGLLSLAPGESPEALRARYGVLVVLFGLGVTLGAFVAALIAFDSSQAVSTAIAPITGLIGTIVGAYFGIQKGAEGKEAADAQRAQASAQATDAERRATKLAGAVTDPNLLGWALETEPPPTASAPTDPAAHAKAAAERRRQEGPPSA